MMSEFDALKRISSYVAENRLKSALEAEVPHMIVEASELEVFDVGAENQHRAKITQKSATSMHRR